MYWERYAQKREELMRKINLIETKRIQESLEKEKKVWTTLVALPLLESGRTKRKETIKGLLKNKPSSNYQSHYFNMLKALYVEACLNIKSDFPDAFDRTPSERILQKSISSITRKKYITSFVIGRHVIDGFFPQHGIGLEVDGNIHDKEFKMKKDARRDENLMSKDLKIKILSVPNYEIQRIANLLKKFFSTNDRLSYVRERRLLTKVYSFTIVKNFSTQEISDYLGLDLNELFKELQGVENV